MPDQKEYTCAHCHLRVRIFVRAGKWKYEKHDDPRTGQECNLSRAEL